MLFLLFALGIPLTLVQTEATEKPHNSSPTNKAHETEEHSADDMAMPELPDKEPNFMDIITLAGSKFMRRASGPMFRSIAKGYFGPQESETDQPPVHNIPSGSIVGTVNDLLSSVTLQKYVDKLSRKAAVVVGTVENDVQPIVSNLLRFEYKRSA